MPVTNYISFGDQIIGEREVGGARRNYGVDALGSVTSTIQGSAIENTYAYKPHGGQLQKTGAAEDPRFKWVGNVGYRSTRRDMADLYVRARHYSLRTMRWTTVDPAANRESGPYNYVLQNPAVRVDPSGQFSVFRQVPAYKYGGDPKQLFPCSDVDATGMPRTTRDSGLNDEASGLGGCTGCWLDNKGVWWRVEFMSAQPVGGKGDSIQRDWNALRLIIMGCAEAHEQVHERQISECCGKFGNMYNFLFGITKNKRWVLGVLSPLWEEYLTQNNDAFECDAYGDTIDNCIGPQMVKACNAGAGYNQNICDWLTAIVRGGVDENGNPVHGFEWQRLTSCARRRQMPCKFQKGNVKTGAGV